RHGICICKRCKVCVRVTGLPTLILCVAVQNCCHLLAGNVLVRCELGCAHARDDTVGLCPCHSLGVPCVLCDVAERGISLRLLTRHTGEHGDQHCAVHIGIGLKSRRAGALEQAVFDRV